MGIGKGRDRGLRVLQTFLLFGACNLIPRTHHASVRVKFPGFATIQVPGLSKMICLSAAGRLHVPG